MPVTSRAAQSELDSAAKANTGGGSPEPPFLILNIEKGKEMNERLEGRVGRLTAQMEKLAGKIEAAPDDPRVERWKSRWLECQQGLKNIRDHGRETVSNTPVGVEIDVPAAPFSVRGA